MLEKLTTECKEIVLLCHNHKKIRDYCNDDFQKLSLFLLKVLFDLGNPKPASPYEIINWTITIGQEYKDFTLPEIKKAIKLCLVGKLYTLEKEYTKVDIGNFHFKPFILICEILTAYREYRKEKMRLHNRNVREELEKIESEKIKQSNFELFKKNWIDTFTREFKEFKKTKTFNLKDPNLSFFKRIYESKFYCLTQTELDHIKEIASKNLNIEEPKDIYDNALPFGVFSKVKKTNKENILRAKISELAIETMFNKWINKGVEIETVLKTINFSYE